VCICLLQHKIHEQAVTNAVQDTSEELVPCSISETDSEDIQQNTLSMLHQTVDAAQCDGEQQHPDIHLDAADEVME